MLERASAGGINAGGDVSVMASAEISIAHYEAAVRKMQEILPQRLPSFYRIAYRVLGNTEDAEDAVQDALLAAHKNLKQFRGEAQMSTWLSAIVCNSARMQLRKRPRATHVSLDSRIGEGDESLSEILEDGRPNPEDECHESKLQGRLIKLVARLSPTLRKTFQLRYVDQLSVSETARVLGVPIGTVKAQTARARAKLLASMRRVLNQRVRCSARRH
jgi:RNA polymerase sigma-70 factor (ECF subfamily)